MLRHHPTFPHQSFCLQVSPERSPPQRAQPCLPLPTTLGPWLFLGYFFFLIALTTIFSYTLPCVFPC